MGVVGGRGACRRYTDTTTGRWTTTDPITHLNDPNNANPYTYAAENPINYTDPTGAGFWDAFGGGCVVAAIGVIESPALEASLALGPEAPTLLVSTACVVGGFATAIATS